MISIVTDSSCDLSDAVIDQHAVTVVPLSIRFGSEAFVDREELSVQAFWDRVADGGPVAETAAPSVGRFADAFSAAQAAGADGVVAITLSSAISGTHSAAVLAARDADIDVRVIDSRVVAGALGLAVLETAEHASSGSTLDAVEAAGRDACERANLFAALDTLDHLRRGGRIGAAAAFFGGLLDIKPLITFADGAVAAAGKVRTTSKARAAVLGHLADAGDLGRIAILTTGAETDPQFVEAVAAASALQPLHLRVGPVVGSHAGPGVLGVAYLRH